MPTYSTNAKATGANTLVAQLRSNLRFGRADFQFRNQGTTDLVLKVIEVSAAGVESAALGSAVTVTPGGIQTVSISSNKTLIRVKTDTTNTGSGAVYILVNYLGQGFQGQLTFDDALTGVGQGVASWPTNAGGWVTADGVTSINGTGK